MQNNAVRIDPSKMPENIKALVNNLEFISDCVSTSRDDKYILVCYKSFADKEITYSLFTYDGSLGAEWYEPLFYN